MKCDSERIPKHLMNCIDLGVLCTDTLRGADRNLPTIHNAIVIKLVLLSGFELTSSGCASSTEVNVLDS
jgi:hypothetical protein